MFVYGCEILRFENPPLSKACQRQKCYTFVRQIWGKLTRKCSKTYDFVFLGKFFNLTLAKHAFLRGETLISGRNKPCCKAFWGPKRHPFVRQNVKSGPFCKAKFSGTHPLKWHTRSIPVIGRPPPPPGPGRPAGATGEHTPERNAPDKEKNGQKNGTALN